jgi:hypothetical protein
MFNHRTVNKKPNEYADAMPDMPKAVMMAIAMSAYANAAFAFPEGDDGEPCEVGSEKSLRRVAYEWQILHNAGIVPQPVGKEWRKYI